MVSASPGISFSAFRNTKPSNSGFFWPVAGNEGVGAACMRSLGFVNWKHTMRLFSNVRATFSAGGLDDEACGCAILSRSGAYLRSWTEILIW